MVEAFWEAETGPELSLYFHLPFCAQKCHYCHFYVIPDKEFFKERLFRGLRLEWQARLPQIQHYSPFSLYFGGGTPYLFGPERLGQVIEWASQAGLSKNCEVTLEANPEDVSIETAKSYRQAGVNRLSIGVQSLIPEQLLELNRLHSAERALEAVHLAKQAGIDNLSIDLMYDLPEQTLEQWQYTLQTAVSLPIKHISIYNLTIEPHTLFYKKRDILAPRLPAPEDSGEMYRMAQQILQKAGFIQYEISAFAKPSYMAKHNTGYWTGRPFFGFGPSAYSFFEGMRFANIANINRYVKLLEQGESPVTTLDALEPNARKCELLAIHLRLLAGVGLSHFIQQHGPLEQETLTAIETLTRQGLLTCKQDRLQLTARGILFYDTVAAELC